MDSIVVWIFFILLCSALIAWWGVQVIRWLSRIESDSVSPEQNQNDPTILVWFRQGWRKVKSGGWHIKAAEVQTVPDAGEVSSESPENQIEGTRDSTFGEPAAVVTESIFGNSSPISPTSMVNLSLSVPAGAKVRITFDNTAGPSGKPVMDVETDQGTADIPVQVQILSAGAAPIMPAETKHDASADRKSSAARKKAPTGKPRGVSLVAVMRKIPLGAALFVLALLVYLASRLIGLDRFPIYFFTDEAVHTLLAEDLVNNRFRYNGVFLPTYFPIGASFGLNSISVYLQVLPLLLFGKSVFITRAVSVLITVLGAAAVGLTLKDYFNNRYWWSGVLLLSIVPTWFLHSRTAFEYAELASFYAIFLYFYLGYRLRSLHYLYFAIIAGALVFYTHGLGQFLIAATAGLLFLVDLPYHWRQRKTFLLGLLLILVLALPYIRFTSANSNIFVEELRTRGSYWLDQNLNFLDKISKFGSEYLSALNPLYWFGSNSIRDLARHQMKGYGHLLLITLPFLLVGLWLAIKNIKSPAHRTILIALLASPFGAAFAQVSVLRTLWLVIPATILTTLGLTALLEWLERRRISHRILSASVFVVLVTVNVYMLQDVLRNGPLWYRDYSLYGMQYGAKQLFGEAIPEILEQTPETRFVVTPTWANGTDNFVRFFLTSEQQSRVRLDSIQAYLFERLPVDQNTLVVLTQPEFDLAQSSPKFKQVAPRQVINYPDGSPGFYFVNLEYSDQADEIFAAEKLARSQPVESQIQVGDQLATIRYSQIDMGQPENIFDGDIYTLMRGLEANPFIIELEFPEPRPISQISADLANMDFTLSAQLFSSPDLAPIVYETTQRGVPGDPHVDLVIDHGPELVSKLRLEILSLNSGDRPHIHVRELNLSP